MAQHTEILWQISHPGTKEKELVQVRSQFELTYTVRTDADPIHGLPSVSLISNRATQPGLDGKPLFVTGDQLNIGFTLERDYNSQELTLFYDFIGSETDTLSLDGQPLAQITGGGEGRLKQNQVLLPALEAGEHTLTLTTAGGNGSHWINSFKLEETSPPQPVPQPTQTMEIQQPSQPQTQEPQNPQEPLSTPASSAPKTSYVPTSMTGLQDYSYWWRYARKHAKTTQPNSKTFRRGRIWA